MYAVVRVRGTANINPSVAKTLELLSLSKANHCVLVSETVEMKGMLRKVKDYTTWGELDAGTLAKLFKYRAKLVGDKCLDLDSLSRATGSDSFEHVAAAVLADKVKYSELVKKLGMKHVIRLHPPVRGFDSVKRSFRVGGALGYRGAEINELLGRMLAIDEQGGPRPKKDKITREKERVAAAKTVEPTPVKTAKKVKTSKKPKPAKGDED